MAEQDDAPPADDAAAPVKPAGKKLLPILLVVFGGLIVGAAGGAFMAGPALARKFVPAAPMTAEDSAKAAEHAADAEAEKGGKEGEATAKVFLLDNMVLNPANSNGQRFLLVSIALRLKDAATEEDLKARDAEVRDALLKVLGTKEVEELSDISQRDALKDELRKALDAVVKPGAIKGLYFPQFVIQ
jgi:flagellar FliL protein